MEVSPFQTRSAAADDCTVTCCVLMMLFIGTAGSLVAATGRNGEVKRWKPGCLGVAGRFFSRSEAALRCPPTQVGNRDVKAPATGAGVAGARKPSCTVSRCLIVFGDSGSAIEEAVAFDDLESVAQDLTEGEAELPLRQNISFALLLTELMVPDCDVLLTGVWLSLRKGKHLSSPTARRPFAYILLASLPKPKNKKTMKAPTSQMYLV